MTIAFDVSDTIEALNAGLFVSPGFGMHAVRVIDSYELIFVTQGRLDMFEEDRPFSLARNQTLLLSPGVRHGGLLPYTPDVNFYWVHFRVRDFPPQPAWVSVPKVATIRDPDALTELFCRFISDQESGILDPLGAAHLVSLMLCAISEDAEEEGGRRARAGAGDEHDALAEAVQGYIDAHFPEPITTSTIATALRYNPDYLERVFRTRTKHVDPRCPAPEAHRRCPGVAAQRGRQEYQRDCVRVRVYGSGLFSKDVQTAHRADSARVPHAVRADPHQHALRQSRRPDHGRFGE